MNLGTNPSCVSASSVAVLAIIDYADGIENSYCDARKDYTAELLAVPFYNGRERGYIIWDKASRLAVAFCEHRNTDEIVIRSFRHDDWNPPTADSLLGAPETAGCNKWSMWEKSFPYNQIVQAAQYITDKFESEYENNI